MSATKSLTPAICREILRDRDLTLRAAAPLLGVHFGHLHKVLSGKRDSASLLKRIWRLPVPETSEKLTDHLTGNKKRRISRKSQPAIAPRAFHYPH